MTADDWAGRGCMKPLAGALFVLGGIASMAKREFGIGKIQPGIRVATGDAALWIGLGVAIVGAAILLHWLWLDVLGRRLRRP